jgi:signal transduction histidine kinase/ActR/RegA family two-component response regulator
MAHGIPDIEAGSAKLSFSRARVTELLQVIERVAAGDIDERLPISPLHDELDAIAYCINVLVGELGWSNARALEALEERAAELRQAVVQAEQASDANSTFIRNVNHEIRTPIAAMLGFADLLASPELSPKDRADLVRGLRVNGQAVLALLGELLDLARLDAGKILLAPETFMVLDLVREVHARLGVEIRAKGISFQIQTGSDALRPIRTDRYRLRQILVNLVGNAVKFTHAGMVAVWVRSAHAGAKDLWTIDVSDTGIGIPPDRQAQLFEPFAQADASITRTYGGTGLGLAVSRRLAEQLGGALVLLHSAPGKGSTFRLTLTSLALSPAAGVSPSMPPTGEASDLGGLRVLLAEDHADIQRAMRRLLESGGAKVELASDGLEAVARAQAGSYDVLLMDVRMPYVSGVEAARVLREGGCTIPIVALTADTSPKTRADALEAGCDACLCKPFTLAELVTAISASRARRSGPDEG